MSGLCLALAFDVGPRLLPASLPSLQVTESEPSVMWLSGLHIPESYLTALVQATCRKNNWPLDRSTLFTQVTKFQDADEVNERAGQGCFVSGLYLEGADWDTERGCLIKSKPKVLVVDLPILKIIPIEAHRLKLQVGGSHLGWFRPSGPLKHRWLNFGGWGKP